MLVFISVNIKIIRERLRDFRLAVLRDYCWVKTHVFFYLRLKPLSAGESPDTNSSSVQEANLSEERPVPRKFWWMKERPQAEIIHTEVASNRTSISEASGDSPQMEGGSATIRPTVRNVNDAEIPVIASPDISSSMAEFLEKEKLCKVVKNGEIVNSLQKSVIVPTICMWSICCLVTDL
jgi:hypothetical protein